MATITKEFTENWRNTNKAKWTISITGTDDVYSSNYIDGYQMLPPDIKIKYVGTNKGYINVYGKLRLSIGGYNTNEAFLIEFWNITGGDISNYMKATSNTFYSMEPFYDDFQFDMSNYFNSDHPTWKTRNIYAQLIEPIFASSNKEELTGTTHGAYYNGYTYEGTINLGIIGTVTLNYPPYLLLNHNPIYPSPMYTKIHSYETTLDYLRAEYGGNITSVTLSVGPTSKIQTYSSEEIENEVISVTPTVAGTFTPTLTVTDSREQTTIKTFNPITIKQYEEPFVNFEVFRSDQQGIKSDEGTSGLIKATVTFVDDFPPTEAPTVTTNNGSPLNNVVWYSNYTSAGIDFNSEIQNWENIESGDIIYGLIDGSVSLTESYTVGVTITDGASHISPLITHTLSTAFYTMDLLAGGHEIAFGAPATEDDLFLELNQQPTDWSTNYNNYYTFNNNTKEFIKNDFENNPGFQANTYYKKEHDSLFKCAMDSEFDQPMTVNNYINNNGLIAYEPSNSNNINALEVIKQNSSNFIVDWNGNVEAAGEITGAVKNITIDVSATTGTKVNVVAYRYGKIVYLIISVYNTASIDAGSNIFVGTINTTSLIPKAIASGSSYWGSHAVGGTIGTDGKITIRNASPSAFSTSSTQPINMSFMYMI